MPVGLGSGAFRKSTRSSLLLVSTVIGVVSIVLLGPPDTKKYLPLAVPLVVVSCINTIGEPDSSVDVEPLEFVSITAKLSNATAVISLSDDPEEEQTFTADGALLKTVVQATPPDR